MNNTIQELDVVALTCDLPEHGLVKGQIGAVVVDFPPDHAEVEFVDPDGHTYALLTLPKNQLLQLRDKPVKAA